jgi:hypothetical protein
MSYARMGETQQRLQQAIKALGKQAEATNAAEDEQPQRSFPIRAVNRSLSMIGNIV